MALHPLDDDPDPITIGTILREFCTFGLFAASLFGLLVLAHGLVHQTPL